MFTAPAQPSIRHNATLSSTVPCVVTNDKNMGLTTILNDKEISDYVFFMDSGSAPGQDGFTGTKSNIIAIHYLLETYGEMSGQCINKGKNNLYLGKHVTSHRAKLLVEDSDFHIGVFPFTYLGVPLFRGTPRKHALRAIADKINAKFLT
ncbi:hypothetical protein Q3G72_015450 [Acer saccharum]|nr:hypothetical protein Q3G72_015450 [Acer saccharum]